MPATMLLQILVTCPYPGPPQCTMFLPMASEQRPSLDKRRLVTPAHEGKSCGLGADHAPDTGASSILKPAAAAAACTARAVSTSMVEEINQELRPYRRRP